MVNPDEDIIYVNNRANIKQESIAKAIALHEITHTTEGTEAYYALMETIDKIATDKNAPQEVLDIIGDMDVRTARTLHNYRDDIKGRSKKAGSYIVVTEVNADLMGDLLGNDYFIEKLAYRNDSLVKKIYHSITSLIKTKNADLSKDSIKYLNKLASKFGKAIDNRRGGVKLSDIGAMDDEMEERGEDNIRFKKMKVPGSDEEFVAIEKDSIKKLLEQPGDSMGAKVRSYLKSFRKTVLPLGTMDKAYMRREAEGEYTNSAKVILEKSFDDKLKATSEFENLLSSAKFIRHKKDDGRHPDAERGWNYYEVKYVIPDELGNLSAYKGEIQIKLIRRGDCFYDITKIEDITNGTAGQTLIKAAGSVYDSSKNSISENSEKINSFDKKSGNERKYISKTVDSEEQITLEDIKTLREISQDGKRKSINDFSSEDIQKTEKLANKLYKELGVKSPYFRAWFGDWREYDKNTFIEKVDQLGDKRKSVINRDTGWEINISGKVHKETNHHSGSAEKNATKYLPYIDDITQKAILFDSETSTKENENSIMFHSLYAYTEVMGYPTILRLRVEELFFYGDRGSGIMRRDYILQSIEEEPIQERNRFSRPNHSRTNSSKISISDLFKIVKQYDKNFKPKPVNPMLLNANGTPKVLYHGTNAEFFEFDKTKIRVDNLGKGFYLVDNKEIANSYATKRTEERGGTSKVMEVYLKTEKPLHTENLTREDVRSFYTYQYMQDGESYEEAIKDAEEDLNYAETTGKNKGWFDGDYSSLVATSDDYFKEWAISEGYDCFIVPGQDKRTGIDGTAFVVFESNQIKSATDNIGTFDRQNPDIRYSRRTTGDDLGIDFVKDEDGGLRIVTNDLELAQKLEENRRNNSDEAKLEAAEEQRKESLRGLVGEELKKEESHLAEVMRLRKYIANNMHLKKYDSKDAIAIIDELMGIVELADEKNPVFAKLKGKKQAEAKRMLIDALNTKEPGERNGAALDIAEFLIYNTTITDAYESNEDVDLAFNIVETLKPYLHNINLDNIKGEIYFKYS